MGQEETTINVSPIAPENGGIDPSMEDKNIKEDTVIENEDKNGVDKKIDTTQKEEKQDSEVTDTKETPTDQKDKTVVSVHSVEDKIEYSSNLPYQLIDVLQSQPFQFTDSSESKITCIEAWELNLYIGTNLGEIIHLYKIDDTLGYIQISKQSFSSSATPKPVRKIVVLPEVSIALIHSGTTISGYLLPELSPANIGKAKDVTDISVDWKDLKIDENKHNKVTKREDYFGESFVKVTIFTKKSIKLLRIFHDSIRLHKELQYTDVKSGLQMSNFSIVSNSANYDLVDISQSQKIFLFPISTTESPDVKLDPIIRYVRKNELLLVCGGSSNSDPAMGMFINLNGDVVRGTLTFESYPTCVEVDYPYVLVVLNNKDVHVYSIHDQTKLQDITFTKEDINVRLHESSRIFEIKDSELAKKITLAPIISTMDNDEIERIAVESDNALKKSVCLSSCILYDTDGKYIKIMKPLSKYDRWMKIYNTCKKEDCLSVYDKLLQEFQESNSNKFLVTLLGFFALGFGMFNQVFEIWTTNFKYLDPRLMIYIFNNGSDGIYGSVWTYQILFDKVEELKVIERTDEMKDFFKLYLNTCLTINFKENTVAIGKSIEVALMKLGIMNKEDLEPVIHEIKYSTNEIIEILLLNKKYFLLSNFYAKLKDHRQLLYYWKGLVDGEFQDDEFDKNFNDVNKSLQFLVNYILTNCVEDSEVIERYSEWLLKGYPKFGLKLITDKRIKQLEINDIKILNMLSKGDKDVSGSNLKLEYLEYIFENKNEKQFLGDLVLIYLDMIIDMHENDGEFRVKIDKAMSEYLTMSSLSKPSIYKYWKIVKDTELDGNKEFVMYHDRLYNYLGLVSVGMKSVLEQKMVLDQCEERIIGNKYSSVFPLITMMIMYKYEDFSGVVDELIELKDYSTAEEFAVSLKLENIEIVSKIKSIRMENMKVGGGGNNSSLLVNDEAVSPSRAGNRVTDELLKKIFDIYLQSNETKLIDNFLNRYDLLNDTMSVDISTVDRMDKFVEVINKVPESFPLDKLRRFMVNNLMEFRDYGNEVNIKKTLVKVEVGRLGRLGEHLQRDSSV